jgi:hypothetical protein
MMAGGHSRWGASSLLAMRASASLRACRGLSLDLLREQVPVFRELEVHALHLLARSGAPQLGRFIRRQLAALDALPRRERKSRGRDGC